MIDAAKQLIKLQSIPHDHVCVFKLTSKVAGTKHKCNGSDTGNNQGNDDEFKFPPSPPSTKLQEKILRCFCADIASNVLEEQGCAVCGQLITNRLFGVLLKDLTKSHFACLTSDVVGITQKEHKHDTDPCTGIAGSILADGCKVVCKTCWQCLQKGKRPKMALANNMWYGNVPYQLQGLSYIEKLLISHVRHNRCIIKVLSSGSHKIIANAISFQHLSQKIYSTLPPPPADLDDVIGFIFTGPNPPTDEDFKQTPLLVRHKKYI